MRQEFSKVKYHRCGDSWYLPNL